MKIYNQYNFKMLKDRYPYMKVGEILSQEIKDYIANTFSWGASPQGADYWEEIDENVFVINQDFLDNLGAIIGLPPTPLPPIEYFL